MTDIHDSTLCSCGMCRWSNNVQARRVLDSEIRTTVENARRLIFDDGVDAQVGKFVVGRDELTPWWRRVWRAIQRRLP